MREKLSKTTNHTLKERLTTQVKELRSFLETLGE